MSTSNRLFVASAIALQALACSGHEKPSEREPTYTKIDDMEGTSGRIEWTPENAPADALPGRWVSYADTQCDDLSPTPEWEPEGSGGWSYTSLPTPYETMPDLISQTAARLRTTAPLVNTWGAGMGFMFSEPPADSSTMPVTRPCTLGTRRDLAYPAAPVDLRRYSGIAFWGKAAQDGAATTIRVQFQDSNTDPRGDVCNPDPGSADECYNGFRVILTLGDTFQRYVVDFGDLEQSPSWGYRPTPSVPDLEHVYGLVFQVDTPGGACPPPIACRTIPELSFDVWIDDIYFVER